VVENFACTVSRMAAAGIDMTAKKIFAEILAATIFRLPRGIRIDKPERLQRLFVLRNRPHFDTAVLRPRNP